jgi:septal ring factor EnvC (AmiA/AmiB activator)
MSKDETSSEISVRIARELVSELKVELNEKIESLEQTNSNLRKDLSQAQQDIRELDRKIDVLDRNTE